MVINKFSKRYGKDFWTKIIQEYIDGKSTMQIEREYQCHRSALRKHLKNANINIRSPKEAGKLYSMAKSPNWKGGRYIDPQNRIWLTTENGQILEAHFIWLKYHPLDDLTGFDIHHLDSNNKNNNIENLIKLTRTEHRKIHQSPTNNWNKYATEYLNGRSCVKIANELKCSRQCVWKNIKPLLPSVTWKNI